MNRLNFKRPHFTAELVLLLMSAAICPAASAGADGPGFAAKRNQADFLPAREARSHSGETKGKTKSGPELEPADKALLLKSYGGLPLSFTANRGQADGRVRFISRGPGYGLLLTPAEALLSLHKAGDGAKTVLKRNPLSTQKLQDKLEPGRFRKSATLRMKFLGGNPSPKMSGLNELPGKVNYFRGKESGLWRTGIPAYAKAKYEAVYPGVDLAFYGNQRQLEYDFIVSPGADLKAVRLGFEGAEKAVIDARGDLVLHTMGGEVRWRRPVAYQTIAGRQRTVEARFVLEDNSAGRGQGKPGKENRMRPAVGFQVAAYDPRQTLVIDPVLAYSSYLGGSDFDSSFGIAVDSAGNAYVAGITYSTDFPVDNALNPDLMGDGEVFVTKFNANGSEVLYSTYLGGLGWERATGIAVDADGNAFVTGVTESADFPVSAAKDPGLSGVSDAFVTKFNASGSKLLFSTYHGGGSDDGSNGLALDTSGNAYIAGYTYSSNFPRVNAFDSTLGGDQDGFVAKFNSTGSEVLYSTFLGGNDLDTAYAIAVDSNGSAHVTGRTISDDFPAVNALYRERSDLSSDPESIGDAFVTKFTAGGSRLSYSTYLGGAYLDSGNAIAVDSSGNAYVAGDTQSGDFPTVNAFYPVYIGGMQDAFVAKVNAAGSKLAYSTFLGGSQDFTGWDSATGIAVDGKGNAFIAGVTESTDFPSVNALFPNLSGYNDAFVTKFDAGGITLFSTYLGGAGSEQSTGIAIDSAGNAYVSGSTYSDDFPVPAGNSKAPPFDPGYNDAGDAFIAKIAFPSTQGNGVPVANAGPDGTVNAGVRVILNGAASYDPDQLPLPLTYHWIQTDGPHVELSGASTVQASFTPLMPGAYVFSLIVNDGESASKADSVTITVNDAAYVLIETPNGGEVWNEKSKQAVTWISHNIDNRQRVTLSLSVDNGSSWKKIASPKIGGSKIWRIPKNRFATRQALFKICVKGNEALCDVSDAVFTVNRVPVSEAGRKQKTVIGTEVVLDGSASYDADKGPSSISYQWFQKSGPPVELNNADTAAPSFTPVNKGTYQFGLIVNDGAADSKLDKVTVTAKEGP